MKFTTTTALAATLAFTTAAPSSPDPASTKPQPGDVFRIMTIRSGSDFQYASLQAATRGLRINLPSQGASCSADVNYASFRLTETGDLYLNTENEPQQLFVDRSGMGQGVIQYTTGVQGIGRNQERGPFAIDDDSNLVFDPRDDGTSTGFQACPNAANGGYSVWLTGAGNPGGNSGCVGFIARALKETSPVVCQYTQ